jgi:RimJ/RimL family protein N-acetyltransferase
MLGMFARWLRRRLDDSSFDLEPASADEWEDERGALVRKGRLVSLRSHTPANREAFQRWYADREIAELLRHDLEPLTPSQSRSYFDTFILPSSARGECFAIHERRTKRLIGTTALTDRTARGGGTSALFRIVIGEKDSWGQGYGTEATRLVAEQAFDVLGLDEVRLEVFSHNDRAIAAYKRVGFETTGEHVEWVPRKSTELRVIEMRLLREAFETNLETFHVRSGAATPDGREERERRRAERAQRRLDRAAARRAGRRNDPTRRPRDGRQEEQPDRELEEPGPD